MRVASNDDHNGRDGSYGYEQFNKFAHTPTYTNVVPSNDRTKVHA